MRYKVSGAIAISKASWGCAPALPNRIREVFLRASFQKTSCRQLKVFRCSSFSKMLPRCGRAAHICGANRNCTMKCNKNLRENRKNRNCLKNQKVVMRYKVLGAIAISKASWGCAPSLPYHTQVVSREEHLFFKKLADIGKIGGSFDISVGLCYNKMTPYVGTAYGAFCKNRGGSLLDRKNPSYGWNCRNHSHYPAIGLEIIPTLHGGCCGRLLCQRY